MSCHGFNASLFAAHFTVKQVISLQVEHARSLSMIDSRSPLLLFLLVMATIPARVQRLIDQLIGLDPLANAALVVGVAFLARSEHAGKIRRVPRAVTVLLFVGTVEMFKLLQVELMWSTATAVMVRIRMEYIGSFINNSWKGKISAGVEITAGRFNVISFRGRWDCGVQEAAGCQHGAHRRMIVIWETHKNQGKSNYIRRSHIWREDFVSWKVKPLLFIIKREERKKCVMRAAF